MTARGFTLVELLVATALGAFLVVGAMGAFAQGRALYERSERLARLHERAAYALAVLEPDIQLAGYYGFHTARSGMRVPAALPAALHRCRHDFAIDVLKPLEGSDQGFDLGCPASGGGAVLYADTLTLRRAQTDSAPAESGRLQVFSDRRSPASQSLRFDGGVESPLQTGVAELRNLVVHSYYVAHHADGAGAAQRNAADPLPALRVKSLSAIGGTPAFIDTEVLGGIEDLQLELGYVPGARGETAPTFVAPGAMPAAARVVAVRIWLRLRAEEYDAGFSDTTHYRYANQWFDAADHYQRLLVSRTIQLRNSGA